jgi:hypothetical protein
VSFKKPPAPAKKVCFYCHKEFEPKTHVQRGLRVCGPCLQLLAGGKEDVVDEAENLEDKLPRHAPGK